MIAFARPRRPKRVVTANRVNFSMEEAAIILGYDMDKMMQVVGRKSLRTYTRPEWKESRTTILDLWEYSLLSGRKLALQ